MTCSECKSPMEPDGFVDNPDDSVDGTDTRWICIFGCGEDVDG